MSRKGDYAYDVKNGFTELTSNQMRTPEMEAAVGLMYDKMAELSEVLAREETIWMFSRIYVRCDICHAVVPFKQATLQKMNVLPTVDDKAERRYEVKERVRMACRTCEDRVPVDQIREK